MLRFLGFFQFHHGSMRRLLRPSQRGENRCTAASHGLLTASSESCQVCGPFVPRNFRSSEMLDLNVWVPVLEVWHVIVRCKVVGISDHLILGFCIALSLAPLTKVICLVVSQAGLCSPEFQFFGCIGASYPHGPLEEVPSLLGQKPSQLAEKAYDSPQCCDKPKPLRIESKGYDVGMSCHQAESSDLATPAKAPVARPVDAMFCVHWNWCNASQHPKILQLEPVDTTTWMDMQHGALERLDFVKTVWQLNSPRKSENPGRKIASSNAASRMGRCSLSSDFRQSWVDRRVACRHIH